MICLAATVFFDLSVSIYKDFRYYMKIADDIDKKNIIVDKDLDN